MKVLVIGGGGREHALAWKAAQSPDVDRVFVAPGNAGTADEDGVENVAIGADDIAALLAFARDTAVDLTLVGPEAPLVAGIVDRFEAAGLACFGPRQAAARLEGSKSFAKDFLIRHGIPTAAYHTFTDPAEAIRWIQDHGAPLVVKADGLAAGKGVVVAPDEAEAVTAVRDMLGGGKFGKAGHKVVIEEYLRGEEASFIAIVDGANFLSLATSQDHKARDDGDRGPNTGGMGAYSPAPVIDTELHVRIENEIIAPTVRGLEADGTTYRGFLYAGLMITPEGDPKVLEFNCRFGDPETQPIMMRLRSDLVGLCRAALDGRLAGNRVEWDPRPALGVVMTAGGYPGPYRKGDVIEGLPVAGGADTKIFHAGTRRDGDHIVTAGGRVLCAVAIGDTVTAAQQRAYALVERISWRDAYYRRDIGYRAVARERQAKD